MKYDVFNWVVNECDGDVKWLVKAQRAWSEKGVNASLPAPVLSKRILFSPSSTSPDNGASNSYGPPDRAIISCVLQIERLDWVWSLLDWGEGERTIGGTVYKCKCVCICLSSGMDRTLELLCLLLIQSRILGMVVGEL